MGGQMKPSCPLPGTFSNRINGIFRSSVSATEHTLRNNALKIRDDCAECHQCRPAYDDPFQPGPGFIHRAAGF